MTMGKRPAGSWEKRPEWIIEVMSTNPTPTDKARWTMLKFETKDGKIKSSRANGTNVSRYMLEEALEILPVHFEQNIRPYLRYQYARDTTYRFRNLVSNEVIPWELLSAE